MMVLQLKHPPYFGQRRLPTGYTGIPADFDLFIYGTVPHPPVVEPHTTGLSLKWDRQPKAQGTLLQTKWTQTLARNNAHLADCIKGPLSVSGSRVPHDLLIVRHASPAGYLPLVPPQLNFQTSLQ